jgi:predicted NodU family carbamoyl transferase
MNTLGISAYYHDSAAALLQDGEVVAAAQEKRFRRKKYNSAFPAGGIRYFLSAEWILNWRVVWTRHIAFTVRGTKSVARCVGIFAPVALRYNYSM